MSPTRPIINLQSYCFLKRSETDSLNEPSHARFIPPNSLLCSALSGARPEMRPNSEDHVREMDEDDEKVTNVLTALRLPCGFKPATERCPDDTLK